MLFACGLLHHFSTLVSNEPAAPGGRVYIGGKKACAGMCHINSSSSSAFIPTCEACLGRDADASLAAVRALRTEDPCFRLLLEDSSGIACMYGDLKQRATFAFRGLQQ